MIKYSFIRILKILYLIITTLISIDMVFDFDNNLLVKHTIIVFS